MIIIFASDHAGFSLKEKLMQWLGDKKNVTLIDVGATTKNFSDDYPFFAAAGARAVLDTKNAKGIFVCGSGVGMAITANRFKGIRALQAEFAETVRRGCREDHANVMVLGARILSFAQAKKLVTVFLHTTPSRAARHAKRVQYIDQV